MSHFSVLVASRSVNEVEELLAPYQEGDVSMCEYAEFMDETELIEDEYREVEGNGDFENIDDFVSNWHGYEKLNGRFGYWWNPQSKWDWYQFGGRFGGLPLIDGGEGNSVAKSEVDFFMDQEQYEFAIREWELLVEDAEPVSEKDKEIIEWNFYKKEYYTENYVSKEAYAKAMASFNTCAYVSPDGGWHAQGEMGWFGVSNQNPNEAISHKLNFYEKYLADLPDDIILTLIDCHI